MILATFKKFDDFGLLDTGNGYRLERWGKAILGRPDPQIIWPPSLPASEWEKAWAVYEGKGEGGSWEKRHALPNPWVISFDDVKFLLKLSPFKHTGLFAEQAAQWGWMKEKLGGAAKGAKILNLFGYTGGATMVLAHAGCEVTHVDASKPSLNWANENYALNFREKEAKVRWMLDDAAKFVAREVKRGAEYDGILMDPPAFGHSPTGKIWKFNQDLPGLLENCVKLLSPRARFLLINGYATNSSALALKNLMEDAMEGHGGKIEFGELCLMQKSQRLISTGIFSRWSN